MQTEVKFVADKHSYTKRIVVTIEINPNDYNIPDNFWDKMHEDIHKSMGQIVDNWREFSAQSHK